MKRTDQELLAPVVTQHASIRMNARRVSESAVLAVLAFGREVHMRGAVIYAIGQNEVKCAKIIGTDLRRYEGLHVVCSKEGAILTVYRNRSFSDLRPGRGKNFRRTSSRTIPPVVQTGRSLHLVA